MHDVEKHLFHCNGIIFKEFHTDSKIKNTSKKLQNSLEYIAKQACFSIEGGSTTNARI